MGSKTHDKHIDSVLLRVIGATDHSHHGCMWVKYLHLEQGLSLELEDQHVIFLQVMFRCKLGPPMVKYKLTCKSLQLHNP